jgi:threonine synthase
MIKYLDTRSYLSEPLPFRDVVLQGLAPGGGLFVPERLPAITPAEIAALSEQPYWRRAAFIYGRFDLGLPAEKVQEICRTAYGSNFNDEDVAVVREVDGWSDDGPFFFLELWHGPTLAFKDMALQCMPLFFSEALEHAHAEGEEAVDKLILVATSGDTGVAALNGFADRSHVKIIVCYPSGGVSTVQEQQMTTQAGNNLTVFAVDGDFDACQRAVKAVFADPEFAAELSCGQSLSLSSANSINWGRLLPQIVYYFSAYADMLQRGALQMGDPLDICVPSGNFGDILGAYYAKQMGLPLGRLVCASNTNNILSDFFSTGVYDISARCLVKTASPSMDILISSNLERLLFETHRDGGQVRTWMQDLAEKGVFQVDAETLALLTRDFAAGWADTETCLQAVRTVFEEDGYLMDPHTAIGWEIARRYKGEAPMLVVSTAHWSKFPADVVRGLRGLPPDGQLAEDEFALVAELDRLDPGSAGAAAVRDIRQRPVRFHNAVEAGAEPLENAIREWLAAR